MNCAQKRALYLGIWAVALSATGAEAKTPAGRYTVNAAGTTVLDTTTGLTWMRQEVCCAQPAQAENLLCKNSTLAGGGWRAPTLRELAALIDRSYSNPVYDAKIFAKLAPNSSPYLLTSTQHFVPGVGTMARAVQVLTGQYANVWPIDTGSMRCVRN